MVTADNRPNPVGEVAAAYFAAGDDTFVMCLDLLRAAKRDEEAEKFERLWDALQRQLCTCGHTAGHHDAGACIHPHCKCDGYTAAPAGGEADYARRIAVTTVHTETTSSGVLRQHAECALCGSVSPCYQFDSQGVWASVARHAATGCQTW